MADNDDYQNDDWIDDQYEDVDDGNDGNDGDDIDYVPDIIPIVGGNNINLSGIFADMLGLFNNMNPNIVVQYPNNTKVKKTKNTKNIKNKRKDFSDFIDDEYDKFDSDIDDIVIDDEDNLNFIEMIVSNEWNEKQVIDYVNQEFKNKNDLTKQLKYYYRLDGIGISKLILQINKTNCELFEKFFEGRKNLISDHLYNLLNNCSYDMRLDLLYHLCQLQSVRKDSCETNAFIFTCTLNDDNNFDKKKVMKIMDHFINDNSTCNLLVKNMKQILQKNTKYTHTQIDLNGCDLIGSIFIIYYTTLAIINDFKYHVNKFNNQDINDLFYCFELSTRICYLNVTNISNHYFSLYTKMHMKENAVLKSKYNKKNINKLKDAVNYLIDYMNDKNILSSNEFGFTLCDIYLEWFNYNKNEQYELSNNVINYLLKIIGNEISENNNKHLRIYTMEVLLKYIDSHNYAIITNYQFAFTCVSSIITDIEYYDLVPRNIIHRYHQDIISLVSYLCSKIDKNDNNKLKTESVIYKIISRANSIIFEIKECCDRITKEIESNKMRNIEISIRNQLKQTFLQYISTIISSIQSLHKLLDSKIIAMIPELALSLVALSKSILELFNNGRNPIYSVMYMNIEALDVLRELLSLIALSCMSSDDFCSELVPIVDILDEMIHTIKLNDELQNQMKIVVVKIRSIAQNLNEQNIELPEEFYDPLLCTLIKDPVMIPNINQIFDRVSIASHIRSMKTNPLTREPLTIEDFDEYQNNEEVKIKINDFKDRMKQEYAKLRKN